MLFVTFVVNYFWRACVTACLPSSAELYVILACLSHTLILYLLTTNHYFPTFPHCNCLLATRQLPSRKFHLRRLDLSAQCPNSLIINHLLRPLNAQHRRNCISHFCTNNYTCRFRLNSQQHNHLQRFSPSFYRINTFLVETTFHDIIPALTPYLKPTFWPPRPLNSFLFKRLA